MTLVRSRAPRVAVRGWLLDVVSSSQESALSNAVFSSPRASASSSVCTALSISVDMSEIVVVIDADGGRDVGDARDPLDGGFDLVRGVLDLRHYVVERGSPLPHRTRCPGVPGSSGLSVSVSVVVFASSAACRTLSSKERGEIGEQVGSRLEIALPRRHRRTDAARSSSAAASVDVIVDSSSPPQPAATSADARETSDDEKPERSFARTRLPPSRLTCLSPARPSTRGPRQRPS